MNQQLVLAFGPRTSAWTLEQTVNDLMALSVAHSLSVSLTYDYGLSCVQSVASIFNTLFCPFSSLIKALQHRYLVPSALLGPLAYSRTITNTAQAPLKRHAEAGVWLTGDSKL